MKHLTIAATATAAAILFAANFTTYAQQNIAGATEATPSHSEYFTWVSNTNEGATDHQTLANLAFFRYLRETYGMQLDIYAFDAGAIDGSKRYGTMQSEKFLRQFPQGFGPLAEYARQDGTRLGLWCGPDGFGDTEEEARARSEMMVSLVRDYNFGLFKMDAVCGPLRPTKYGYFEDMMAQIRALSPDFVLLNHRLNLGPGTKYSTTNLFEGAETYIDVHMANDVTAPHHRVEALSRAVPPSRLVEDHGVCLSSYLDYWDDDLILQAFNRDLILAPEIYGNPWLLRDDELPQLAFIFNLHRDYRDILVNGLALPEESYGLHAMSRGDGRTRMVTLRNMSWEPKTYKLSLSDELGLDKASKVKVRMYHPYILDMGSHAYGSEVEVTVLPFRTCLVKVTSAPEIDRVTVSGVPYQIINDRVGDHARIKLLGRPGETYSYRIKSGKKVKSGTVTFPGEKLKDSPLRHISAMDKCTLTPSEASAVYYATAFAADNNALEARSLKRSGESAIPEVRKAREEFFGQPTFVDRGIWDRNLFDGDPDTYFNIAFSRGDMRLDNGSMFALDLGTKTALDSLVISTDTDYSITPLKVEEGTYVSVSDDLVHWKQLLMINKRHAVVDMREAGAVRYIRFAKCPIRLAEVTGYKDGREVSRELWHASNLFSEYGNGVGKASCSWKTSFVLDEIPANSYLCVAVNGRHGREGAWAGFRIDGEYVGCPDRAPAYLINTWECNVRQKEQNYTFYLPLTEDMKGKTIEAFVIGMDKYAEGSLELKPEVWMSAYPLPFEKVEVTL